LITRYPSLRTTIADPELTDVVTFHKNLKNLVLEAGTSEYIYLHGHNHLRTYAEWGAARPQDHVFTTVRDPVDLIISQINYVLTRMASDETPLPHDTGGWRAEFDVHDVSILESKAEVVRLAQQILRHTGVVPINNTCAFLGNGTSADALERLAIYDVEITDLRRYPQWIRDRWQIHHQTRMNPSRRFVTLADFAPADIEYINSITHEDQLFFRHISDRLDGTGKSSLRGTEALPAGDGAAGSRATPVLAGAA
jgi:hypothetical protein